jgi:putative FmdB family regulatory protein
LALAGVECQARGHRTTIEDARRTVPTYQYACTECGYAFEEFQSFSDDALTECPSCAGRLRKLFNAVGVVFKGSGFYRTDSRAGSSSTDGGPTKTETKTEPKTETKPASKTDSKPAVTASASAD